MRGRRPNGLGHDRVHSDCLQSGSPLWCVILPKATSADLTLLDESKARRIAQDAGLSVVGCVGLLEAGWRNGIVPDLRQAYTDFAAARIRLDLNLLQDSSDCRDYDESNSIAPSIQ